MLMGARGVQALVCGSKTSAELMKVPFQPPAAYSLPPERRHAQIHASGAHWRRLRPGVGGGVVDLDRSDLVECVEATHHVDLVR